MNLDDYYWDGTQYRKKQKFSDLLLGLHASSAKQLASSENLYSNLLLGLQVSSAKQLASLGNLYSSSLLPPTFTTMWERFDKFLSNLELSSQQKQDALSKAANVGKSLSNKYYPLFGATHPAHIVVGSYMKGLAISPPTDIDILFILPPEDFKRFGMYAVNGQSALLQEVRNCLLGTFPSTEVKADGQAVLAPFESYSVEVIPCFDNGNGMFVTPDSTNGGRWKLTCPAEEKRILETISNWSSGNAVKLIKMIKAWKSYCSVEIKSLVIELHATYFLRNWQYFNNGSVYHDWMIRDFFTSLIQFVGGSCQIPGIEEKVLYGDSWKSKAETALLRAKRACDYERDKKTSLAVEEWQKIFGYRFPN